MGYTASEAFFEAIWQAGVSHVFVNLGSDHPAIMEATLRIEHATPHTLAGQREGVRARDRVPETRLFSSG